MRNRFLGASVLAMAVAQAGAVRAQTGADTGSRVTNKVEEVVVTASKRSEKLQKVPISIQLLGSKALQQLHINSTAETLKFLPSLTANSVGPDNTTFYIRGIASGSEGNHSGPLPTVGSYLDEQPITTIGGTLDVHIYDIDHIEVLPGPQGTLYGASSEAGTVRIITQQPKLGKFEAGYDLEGNVVAHGTEGGVAEGFVNIPVNEHIAIRLVGFDEHDSGYIDNVAGTRSYDINNFDGTFTHTGTVNNAAFVKSHFNPTDTFGGRATARIELNDEWSITPSVIFQDLRDTGTFGFEPSVGDLKVQRFQPDTQHDRWVQAGTTIQGKIGNFDVTYAGGFFVRDNRQRTDYTDYSVAYDSGFGSGANWQNAAGNPLPTPAQEIIGIDHFNKESNELRVNSPADYWLRFTAGAFQEVQNHRIIQDYQIQGFGPQIAIPGWPNTIWLTDQLRTDRDQAVFVDASADVLPGFTITGGVRPYWYSNSLKGFFGFSQAYDRLLGSQTGQGQDLPPNPVTGAFRGTNCIAGTAFSEAPCVNLDKNTTGNGETHKVNLQYKIDDLRMVYFTYSTGYRPGGINRNGNYSGYLADTLTNYELGLKSTWLGGRLHANFTVYDEDWENFQYAFLGPSSLTIIGNAKGANVKGADVQADWRVTDQFSLFGGATISDAELSENLCKTVTASCTAATAQAPASTRLPYVSNFKGNITGRYTFPVLDWGANVQASAVYQSSAQVALLSNDSNGFNEKTALGSLPGYATFDFSAGLERNKLSLNLFIKNAFDRRGETNRQVACTIGVCTNVYAYPIQPLTVGLRLSQRF